MKVLLSLFAILHFSLFLSAQQTTNKQAGNPPAALKLATPADTLQYTLGAFLGQWLTANGFTVTSPAIFNRGFEDVLLKRPLAVTDSTIVNRIAAYQITMQNERSKQLEEQLFAAVRGKPGVGALPDGVHYIVIKTGTGIRPLATDTVVVNAVGVFPDGTEFENTIKKKQAITILAGNLIPGLSETIQLMPEGSSWRIFVPSVLAYGPAGLGNVIPPNTALVFDLTLEKVKPGIR